PRTVAPTPHVTPPTIRLLPEVMEYD
ncbi:MAG: hypothetical protein QOF61_2002, partial [Acidobacteriota bacterium]|nr:hypothetical protein [Acidobacteriota bacterium]